MIGGGSDEDAGLDLLHDLQQVNLAVLPFPAGNLGSRAGVFLLVVGQPLHVIGHQTVDVDQPDTLPGFFTAQAVTFHGGADLVGHAGAGGTRAVHHQPLIGKALFRHLQPGDHGRHDDGAGSLHVIVEDAVALAVLHQDAASVARPEVLEVQERPGKHFTGHLQIGIDEALVAFATHTGMAIAQVGEIVEQLLVVGAHVQIHGDHPVRVDTRGGRVDSQLANGDIGTVHAPVTDAQDLLCIRDHQQVHVIGPQPQRFEGCSNVLGMIHIQVHGARTTVVPAPFLDGLTDGRVVNDGQHFHQVIGQQPVVEHLVSVVQLVQVDVLLDVAFIAGILAVGTRGLLLQRLHGHRQPAGQSIPGTLFQGEGRALVGERILQDVGGLAHCWLLSVACAQLEGTA